MKSPKTYTAAIEELEQIVEDIESADISVDDLSAKVERAAFLIQWCRKKLRSTEQEVDKVLDQMEGEEE